MSSSTIETNLVELRIKQLASAICILGGDDPANSKLKTWDAACDALKTYRKEVLEECRALCMATGMAAHEAAKAKDATDYIAGYQDAAVDIDEEIRSIIDREVVE